MFFSKIFQKTKRNDKEIQEHGVDLLHSKRERKRREKWYDAEYTIEEMMFYDWLDEDL